MGLILVDTSVLIASERSGIDLDRFIDDGDEPAVAAITIAELNVGVALASGRRRAHRRSLLDDVVALLPVIDYDIEVAQAHGALIVASRRSGRPRGSHDLMIAATAVVSGRTILSNDRRGFDGLPGVLVRTPAG